MAEVIVETIIPGTYIEVRPEGLLTVGGISTGNVGIIGTAEKGSGKIEVLSSFEEGRAKFGNQTPWDPHADGTNLTLVRSLKFLFDNGARTVYAQRVFDEESAASAVYSIKRDDGVILKLRAKTPGTWGNRLQIRIEEVESQEFISNELIIRNNGNYTLSAEKILESQSDEESIGNVTVKDQGFTKKYQLKRAHASPSIVQVNPSNRNLTFSTPPPPTAEIYASYWVPAKKSDDGCWLRKITLRYDNLQEVYIIPSTYYLKQLVTEERNPSRLVEVEEFVASGLPSETTGFENFTGGENGCVALMHYKATLEKLVEKNVQIVVISGLGFSEIKSNILGHLEKTENLGRERIAVIGADQNQVEKIMENTNEVADKRVILVAPGIKQKDPESGRMIDLPPYFTAAAVAGKLSSISPHISLTNKTLKGIDQLSVEYSYGQMKSLVENRVLVLSKKRGIRVVKGITTHDGAYKQASVRRIVDLIKEGSRRAGNQYIGRLNNSRVRGALHTTLNGFLTDMVTREFLTEYKLNVFADRAMEINGFVQVIMDLKPAFSIDVIRVIMNLS